MAAAGADMTQRPNWIEIAIIAGVIVAAALLILGA